MSDFNLLIAAAIGAAAGIGGVLAQAVHRHTFAPEKWIVVSDIGTVREERDTGNERVYSNACLTCGDLVFRRVKELEE